METENYTPKLSTLRLRVYDFREEEDCALIIDLALTVPQGYLENHKARVHWADQLVLDGWEGQAISPQMFFSKGKLNAHLVVALISDEG